MQKLPFLNADGKQELDDARLQITYNYMDLSTIPSISINQYINVKKEPPVLLGTIAHYTLINKEQ